MKWIKSILVIVLSMTLHPNAKADEKPTLHIGSKNFTESYILAEILAQKVEASGLAKVKRSFGMGGTGILFEALSNGSIDIYPEYTGTLSIAVLQSKSPLELEVLRAKMADKNMRVSDPLGFNNSYGLAIRKELSEKLGIRKITDLKSHRGLRMAFSYEFMEREDGYRALVQHYNLQTEKPVRMDHSLVYSSIEQNKSDVIEVYTTDSKINKFDLVVLEDDKAFFPRYDGVFLYRKTVLEKVPGLDKILAEMSGKISENKMTRLNGLVELSNKSFAQAAEEFVQGKISTGSSQTTYLSTLIRQTKRHLLLVFFPTVISILLGIPLGVIAAKSKQVGQVTLMSTGLVQTIPSLALLCFLIPVFGIGLVPAIIALVLYGLLPIVRNTYSGIMTIDPRHHEVAKVLGLSTWQKLLRIEFPMASVHIVGGIKTAAIINVGMATLAAFIGAGGYGALIVTGLALNNNTIILQGALPAAVMAILLHGLFELLDRWLIPKGLRN